VIADAIRTEFNISEDEFWGSYSGLKDDLVERRNSLRSAWKRQDNIIAKNREAYSKIEAKRKISPASIRSAADIDGADVPELIAVTKIIYAKKIYEARWGKRKPSSIKEGDISKKGDIFDFEGWESSFPGLACSGEPIECPACGYPEGWAYGHVTSQPCGCETPGKGDCAHNGGLRIWARNSMFHCEACSLESHNEGELIAFGIDLEKKELLITPVPIRFEGREKQ
jgi:hypothetical protein